jgi:hypothetical protein
MTRVVILHAADDSAPARALAEKLRMMRLSATYDEPPGPALREAMEDAICTLALWSPRSAARPDLIGEAAFAHNTGRLVHVRMHNAEPPLEFSLDPSVNLTGWRGEDEFPGWRDLAVAITHHLDAARAAAAAAAAATAAPPPPPPVVAPPPPLVAPPPPVYVEPPVEPGGAFHARPPAGGGIYDEPPRERNSTLQLAVIGIVTFVVVAAVGIGGYALYQSQHGAAEAARLWRGTDQTDVDELRAFLASPFADRYRAEAEAALEGLELARLEEARREDTIEALTAFLDDFPESRHAVQVRGRIAELRQAGPSLATPDASALTAPAPLEPAPADSGVGVGAQPVPLNPAPQPDGIDGGPAALTPARPNAAAEEELRRALEAEASPLQ